MNRSFCFVLGVAFGIAMPIHAEVPTVDAQTAGSSGSGTASANQSGSEPGARQSASRQLKDPIELCEKLAGVEREICVRQAQENRERAADAGMGATPGGSGGTVTGGAAPSRDDDARAAKRGGSSIR